MVFANIARLGFGVILTVAAAPAYAHSGGTDAYGCHAGRLPYHCHGGGDARPAAPEVLFLTGGARGGDMDCADFFGWQQAQSFYLESGADDTHRLDADRDGIACESLQ